MSIFGKHPKKTKGEDISEPTEADLTVKPEDEIITLAMGEGGIEPVMAKEKAKPAAPKAKQPKLQAVIELVDALATKCSDGYTPQLAEIRDLRNQIAALANE